MKSIGTEVKVGALFLIALLVFSYFAVKVGSLRLPWHAKGYIINVYFDNIAGLEQKAPVRLAGVRIGTVKKISLENGKAKIEAEIEPQIKIQKDASVNVSQMGVMGEKYLEIIRGTPGAPHLSAGDTLTGAPPTSFDQVISVINSIGHDIKSVTSSLRRVLASQEGEARMELIMDNVQRISKDLSTILAANQENMKLTMDNVQALSSSLRAMVDNNSDDVTNTVHNLQDFTRTLADKTPALLEKLEKLVASINGFLPEEGTTMEQSLNNLQQATHDLKDSLASVKNIVGKVDQGEGTIGKLINDDQAHRNLNAALSNLNETLDEAKNVLGRIEKYETELGYRAEYLNDSDSWKHFISLKIKPRHDKYYLIEVIDSPYGYMTETTTHTFTTTDSSTTGYEEVDIYQEEMKIEDEFLINLQIAKELHNLTFRAGLIETRGGVGLDLGFWRQNVLFSVDGWDFGREEHNFHLKFSGRLALYHGIYLVGGWDDLLNDEIDSFFIGAGVLFTDEDLKYMLGVLASVAG
ncbi:MlaD family protein [candidate division CSSED10-310 bacterium]|uniref:MlaD family protein n=1 Tax=candidate division CSSED10-310 bacterium TaxID=2855610 RepID=A0ABV6YW79_UNCC1